MVRVGLLVRLLVGLVALAAVSMPPLERLKREAEETECARRRAACAEPDIWRAGVDACPRGNVPYLYEVESDGGVAVRCPHGHGWEPLRLHVWVAIP